MGLNTNLEMPVTPSMYGGANGDDNFFKYLIFLGLVNGGNGLFGGNRNAGIAEAISLEGNWTTTIGKLDGITQGISQLGYSNLEGQNGIQTAISNGLCNVGYQMGQGFNGVDKAICSSTWNISRELMGLSSTLAECCCNTNRNIDALRYDMSKGFCDVITAGYNNTRDIIGATDRGTQRIVDLITTNNMQALRDENAALKLSASQQAQTASMKAYTDDAIKNSTEIILKHLAYINGPK